MGHVGSGPLDIHRDSEMSEPGLYKWSKMEQTLPKASPNLFIGAAVVVRGPGVGTALAIHGNLFGNRTSE